MRTVQDIYTAYDIMPTLQLHQLRVAAVAEIICEKFKENIDAKSVITACLFHDMGNIIKSDLPRFPEFLKPQGIEFWQAVKDRFIAKYGPNETLATYTIASEIGLSESIVNCLKHTGFANAEKNGLNPSFENKICNYSDMRVGPYGVLSMEERMEEGRKRYAGRTHSVASDRFEVLAQALRAIEKDIFEKTDIKPEYITEAKVAARIESLRKIEV